MRHGLLLLWGLWGLTRCGSADIQNFIHCVQGLQETYEIHGIDRAQFFESVVNQTLTPEEMEDISQTKIPQKTDVSNISKEDWTQLEERIFARILLLVLDGALHQASMLLQQLDIIAKQIRISCVPLQCPWDDLRECIEPSH